MILPRIPERTVTPDPGKPKAAKITFPSAKKVLKPTADGIIQAWPGRHSFHVMHVTCLTVVPSCMCPPPKSRIACAPDPEETMAGGMREISRS